MGHLGSQKEMTCKNLWRKQWNSRRHIYPDRLKMVGGSRFQISIHYTKIKPYAPLKPIETFHAKGVGNQIWTSWSMNFKSKPKKLLASIPPTENCSWTSTATAERNLLFILSPKFGIATQRNHCSASKSAAAIGKWSSHLANKRHMANIIIIHYIYSTCLQRCESDFRSQSVGDHDERIWENIITRGAWSLNKLDWISAFI